MRRFAKLYKPLLLIVIIGLISCNNIILAQTKVNFHEPRLTVQEALVIVESHLEKSKIAISKYILDSVSYNYIKQQWTFHYVGIERKMDDEYLIILPDNKNDEVRINHGT